MFAVLSAILLTFIAPGTGGSAAPTSGKPVWEWPMDGRPPVLRHFDRPPERWMAGHRGVDLRLTVGAPIRSPADGVIVFVGKVVDRPVITVDHGNGLLSSFEPAEATLAKGTAVAAGEQIGHLSTEPHCPQSCLHWGVRDHGEYVNPLNFVTDRRPSVLLPLNSS